MNPILNYLLSSLSIGMTFLYGCTGEILTEKSGHLNLGIPGIMCMGGAGGCFALSLMYKSGIPELLIVLLALIATFVTGMLMGMIYCFLTVTLKANQNVTGLAMTTFGVGTMKFIMSQFSGAGKSLRYLYALKAFRFPFADQKDSSLMYCGFMVLLAIAIALVTAFVLHRTKVGLHLRAVGENPATADAAGIRVSFYKYAATCIGSGIAALGGIFYIMVYSGSPEAYKSIEPFGWLSIALVIFTLWKPHISIFGAIIFGALYLAGSYVYTFGLKLPMYASYLFEMLPYVVTILVLIVTSVRNKRENQPPASLGLPYFREER